MTTDLGTDFYCDGDITPGLDVVSGRLGLALALTRRLWGEIFYDPNYGLDIRELINSCQGETWEIESEVRSEFLKDERVESVQCRAEFIGETLNIHCVVDSVDGPFSFVVGVDALDIQMYDFAEAA